MELTGVSHSLKSKGHDAMNFAAIERTAQESSRVSGVQEFRVGGMAADSEWAHGIVC